MVMLACKGFEPGLVATHGSGEYKYHPGLNTTEKAFCAQTGFHCAENPLECFNWYPWDGKNEFWLVEPKGDIDDDGKKISCTEMYLVARLNEMRFLRLVQAYLLGHPECEESWTHKSSGPIHVYKGKNISAAGKLGDYILFINTFMKGMASSTIIHIDGKKYMKRIRKLYEYKGEKYSIIVPADLFDIVKDSTFLGHCVANTNRYYERISSEESYIVFLRYTDKPSRPWYTLEIEPGGTIRQKRSYSNEQYSDLQEAVPFLKEWQQVVQKRMDEKERKLAVESKEKRNKEFEELTVNGNIIHTGRYAGKLLVDELMKDLMEAAATA